MAVLSRLPDPGVERSREHELTDLLVIAVCTLLVGGESFYDMEDFGHAREEWLRGFLRLPNGIPSHDTFNRLFQALNPAAFAEAFAQWTQGVRERLDRKVVALDGKAARRATVAGQNPRPLVSAWATESGLTLGQRQVSEKSNEITADALPCQTTIAKEITEADADYVLALKGNQGTVHAEVRMYLDDAIARQDRRWPPTPRGTRATAGWRPAATGRAGRLAGLPTGPNGPACGASAWWKPPAKRAGKPRWNGATT